MAPVEPVADSPVASSSVAPGPAPAALPEWYPPWARSLAELYFSGTTCVFVVHGNVHDLIRCPGTDGTDSYCNLSEFLATQVFGSWDVVVQYDLARGLRASSPGNPQRLQGMVQHLALRLGDPTAWPRDADNVLLALDR